MERTISYTALVRAATLATLSLALHAIACGGAATRKDGGSAAAGAAGASAGGDTGQGTGGVCPDPVSAIPDTAPFVPPPIGVLGAFQVTFRNRCAKTVWPAWGSGGGLDNSVIDTQLWSPLVPSSDRSVVVYGGVRDIGFWARTGCSFEQSGSGVCETGECGGFACPIVVNSFPASATVFVLQQGFLDGYNVGLRVEGSACGNHECLGDVAHCSDGSAVEDSCGTIVACRDICGASGSACCREQGSRCDPRQFDYDPAGSDALVITFCP